MDAGKKPRIVVGMSGATGQIYGIRLVETLKAMGAEVHLVMSDWARRTTSLETQYTPEEVESLADYVYDNRDVGAAIASGSFHHDGMVIVPCSVKTLSGVANSWNENLLIRAADVTLKERKRLVLVVRETPLHRGHLELMLRAVDIGATILPPMPAFYYRPRAVNDIVIHTVARILDALDVRQELIKEWTGVSEVLHGEDLQVI
ncbi:MAG: UbiX family flavin prenyltransferase [Clostridia bacterium]|nr:UbiX family flavin prenyltransferase [Clostridia bacterium]